MQSAKASRQEPNVSESSLIFEIHPSSGVPIYRQLMDQVRALVVSKRLRPGDALPSIRQLALDLEVNMMTVSKAYARLEADGVLERVRGLGMRVRASKPTGSAAERQQELEPLAHAMVIRGLQLGLTEAQILSVVRNLLKDQQSWQKTSSTSST
jgi:GntR family transcriptional regulator